MGCGDLTVIEMEPDEEITATRNGRLRVRECWSLVGVRMGKGPIRSASSIDAFRQPLPRRVFRDGSRGSTARSIKTRNSGATLKNQARTDTCAAPSRLAGICVGVLKHTV